VLRLVQELLVIESRTKFCPVQLCDLIKMARGSGDRERNILGDIPYDRYKPLIPRADE